MLPPIPPDDLLPPFRETDWHYCRAIAARGDTWQHLATLRALAEAVSQSEEMDAKGRRSWSPQFGSVVEFGVRSVVTTWAFLAARPRSLVSVDIEDPPMDARIAAETCAAEEGIDFRFLWGSTLEIEPVSCDLLFIDTLHTHRQLRAELERHAAGVARFIAFHDTVTFGFVGMDGTRPGLQDAIEELIAGKIAGTGKWALRWHDEKCNGLCVVERVG